MKRAFTLNNFQLAAAAGTTIEGFPKYLFDISTTKMNSQSFRISKETLQHIANQANAGVPVYKNHRTYSEDPSGYTLSASLVGNKVQSELYIQPGLPDVDTDSLIARLDAGTLRNGSIQFLGGDFMCDLDSTKFKYADDGWFYSFKCEHGHRLGKEYEKGRATAIVRGMVNLIEFSVAGMGADPGTGIVKKLSEEYGDDLDMGIVHALSEINGFDITQFSQRLGYDETTKKFSFPSITPRRTQMAMPTPSPTPAPSDDVQVLQEQVERLSAENTTLSAEKANLQTQLDEVLPEGDIADLNRQVTELTTSINEKDAEIARLTTLSEVGEEALRLERENAKRSVLLEMDLDPSTDNSNNYEYTRRCNDIDNMMSLSAIKSIATTNFRSARNRKGAKLETPEDTPIQPEVRFSGMNNL